jgi:hypothetical protein
MSVRHKISDVKKRKSSSSRLSGALSPLPGGRAATARKTVGADDFSRLRWLLQFVSREPEAFANLSKDQLLDLEAQMAAFCESVGSFLGGQQSQLTLEELADLVREIFGRLQARFSCGASLEFEIPSVTLVSSPGDLPHYIGRHTAIFRLAVSRLIEMEGERIRVCARAGCHRLFGRRKRALYCGHGCSQMERFRRYVERHPAAERSQKRFELYKRQVEKTRGKAFAAKIRRRIPRKN